MSRTNASPAANDFAVRFDEALVARGISQHELERIIHVSGGQISKMRTRGAQRIEPGTMFAIADALDVEARWLFTGAGLRRRGDTPAATQNAVSADVARLRERIAHLEQAMRVVESTSRAVLRR